ncbi:unnamed protein product, partial [Didymodactylos carnosus]
MADSIQVYCKFEHRIKGLADVVFVLTQMEKIAQLTCWLTLNQKQQQQEQIPEFDDDFKKRWKQEEEDESDHKEQKQPQECTYECCAFFTDDQCVRLGCCHIFHEHCVLERYFCSICQLKQCPICKTKITELKFFTLKIVVERMCQIIRRQ